MIEQPTKFKSVLQYIQVLRSLETLQAQLNNVCKNFKEIGSGSSRRVFEFDDTYVIKMATCDGGISQNKAEASVIGFDDIVARIIATDHFYHWIIMEKVNTDISDDTIEGLEHSRQHIKLYLEDVFIRDVRYKPNLFHRSLTQLEENEVNVSQISATPIVNRLKDFMVKYKLETADMMKNSSWGVRADGVPVICDYGLSIEVWDNHYDNWVGMDRLVENLE